MGSQTDASQMALTTNRIVTQRSSASHSPAWKHQFWISSKHSYELFPSFEDSGPISNFDSFFSPSDEIDYAGFDVGETEYCEFLHTYCKSNCMIDTF